MNTSDNRFRGKSFFSFIVYTVAIIACLQGSFLTSKAENSGNDFFAELALDFDGNSTYIDTGITAGEMRIDGDAPKSIEAWVYTEGFDLHGGVFSIGQRGPAGRDFSLVTRDDPDDWKIVFWAMDIDFSYPSKNRWVHFALTYSGTEAVLYADGSEIERESRELDTGNEGTFRIGRWWDRDDGLFEGRIAEVRVWDRALEEDEINENMNQRLSGDEEGLVGYWPLDEGAGNEVRERVEDVTDRIRGDVGWGIVEPFDVDLVEGKAVTTGDSVVLGPVRLRQPVGEVSYQWYRDDEPVSGATESTLEIENILDEHLGYYHVQVDDERELTPVASNRVPVTEPDWPMWRFDAARSADTPVKLEEDLTLQWVRNLPEPLRAWRHQIDDRGKLDFDISYVPVVKGDKIFVPSNATDSLTAYHIEDGSEIWRFYADGPVRLAPVAYEESVYFISDDGYLYCLEAETGRLEWKFRGGPSDNRLLGNERIINFWAARGGPVVEAGVIYFAAGIWPQHGVFIYALDAKTGELEWVNDTTSSDYVALPHGGAYGYGGLAPQGYLAISGSQLVVAGGRTPPAFFCLETGEFEEARFRPPNRPFWDGDYAVHAGGTGKQKNQMLEDRVEALSEEIAEEVFYKLGARDRLFVSTEKGTLYCFGPDETDVLYHDYEPEPLRPETDNWSETAEMLLDSLGESKGYALIAGVGSGDLIREIIIGSDMHVVVVENDADKVGEIRSELVKTGMYGRRAAVIEADPALFKAQPYLFSLLMSENATDAGLFTEKGATEQTLDLLRPYGGLAWFGTAEADQRDLADFIDGVSVNGVSVEIRDDHIFAQRERALQGAGEWTHQYQDAANTLFSRDELVRLPLGLLWFGGPNNHNILPRHAGGPRPQVAGGRQVFLGVETISARCVYTGRELWEKELPGIGHPFTIVNSESAWEEDHKVYMAGPHGATYIGSPYITLSDSIYVRYEGDVYRLDPDSGEITAEFTPPGRTTEDIYDDEGAPEWGHISAQNDYLIVTSEPHIFENEEIGDVGSYSGSSSRRLAVLDRHSGELIWDVEADAGFRHNAIVSSEETLFVIDGLSEEALARLARRGEKAQTPQRILAFDLDSGEEIWQSDSDVFGTQLLLSTEHKTLIEGGNNDYRTAPPEDEPVDTMLARNAENGEVLWQRGGNFSMPGAISGDKLIPGRPGPEVRSIHTGEDIMHTNPHTGETVPFTYDRDYGCGTLNASPHLLLFRTGYGGFYDVGYNSGTGSFGGFRSGCTSNLIAADGVMNALDYTRTCTCSYAHQTSLAMVHMPGDHNIEFWTRYDAGLRDPKVHGLNFGAPGRRVDVAGEGIVWYDEPGTKRRHPSLITEANGTIPWVAASMLEGEETLEFSDLLDGGYMVKLHFAELNADAQPGERVFDVFLNGEKVLEDFDIVTRTGETLQGVVKEFSTDIAGNTLEVELARSGTTELDPIINGIKLTAETTRE